MLFGAEIIRYTSVDEMLVIAPNLILYAAPLMFLFVLIEYFFSRFHNHNLYEKKETIGSVIVGVGNVVIGLFIKTILFVLFITVYNWVPWRMEIAWWTLVLCYIVFDFCFTINKFTYLLLNTEGNEKRIFERLRRIEFLCLGRYRKNMIEFCLPLFKMKIPPINSVTFYFFPG